MTSVPRFLLLIIFGMVFGTGPDFSFSKPADKISPVYNLNDNTYIREWLVAGPFPNPPTDEPLPDGSYHYGYYTDFLKSIGGERQAVFETSTTIQYLDQNSVTRAIRPLLLNAAENGIVDFDKMFQQTDQKVAYAFCFINSDKNQEARFLLGSDDGVKVWINGELVHANYVARSIVPREDQFQAMLKPGLNPILVKVEDRVRDWGFVLETIDAAGFQKMLEAEQARADYQAFLYCPIVPKKMNTWNFVFNPGQFPELQWEQPYLVEKAVGKFPLTIRWFDAQLNEVKTADQPGRYAYVAEGTTPNGIKIRRAATLYCMPPQWISWGERPRAALEYLPVDFISKSAWEAHREPISYFTGRSVLLSIIRQQEGAMLLSYLHEIRTDETSPELTDTPIIRDHDYHLALKRKLLGVEKKWPQLQRFCGWTWTMIW